MNTKKGNFPSFLLDVSRLKLSQLMLSYMTKFSKILLDKFKIVWYNTDTNKGKR